MSSDIDKFVEEMEEKLWSSFSDTVKEHARNPRNIGDLEDYDSYAEITGECGDSIQIWIKVKDNKLEDVSFWTNGCGTTIASGSMITELSKGKDIDEVLNITPLQVLDALDGLPEESTHCAFLATNTMHEAIKKFKKQN